MKSNTTGLSMETIFDSILFFMIAGIAASNFVIFAKLLKISSSSERIEKDYLEILESLIENFGEVDDKVVHVSNSIDTLKVDLSEHIDRSTLALRENLEPTKPMKSNNWDSMREAFKGPTRVEINERN